MSRTKKPPELWGCARACSMQDPGWTVVTSRTGPPMTPARGQMRDEHDTTRRKLCLDSSLSLDANLLILFS